MYERTEMWLIHGVWKVTSMSKWHLLIVDCLYGPQTSICKSSNRGEVLETPEGKGKTCCLAKGQTLQINLNYTLAERLKSLFFKNLK